MKPKPKVEELTVDVDTPPNLPPCDVSDESSLSPSVSSCSTLSLLSIGPPLSNFTTKMLEEQALQREQERAQQRAPGQQRAQAQQPTCMSGPPLAMVREYFEMHFDPPRVSTASTPGTSGQAGKKKRGKGKASQPAAATAASSSQAAAAAASSSSSSALLLAEVQAQTPAKPKGKKGNNNAKAATQQSTKVSAPPKAKSTPAKASAATAPSLVKEAPIKPKKSKKKKKAAAAVPIDEDDDDDDDIPPPKLEPCTSKAVPRNQRGITSAVKVINPKGPTSSAKASVSAGSDTPSRKTKDDKSDISFNPDEASPSDRMDTFSGHFADLESGPMTPLSRVDLDYLDEAANNLTLQEERGSEECKNVSDVEIDNSIVSASGQKIDMPGSSGVEPTVNGELLSCAELPYSRLEEFPTITAYAARKDEANGGTEDKEPPSAPHGTVIMEDLDLLQGELETVLTSTVSRSRLVRRERNILDSVETIRVDKPCPPAVKSKSYSRRERKKKLKLALESEMESSSSPAASSTPKQQASQNKPKRLAKARELSPVPSTSQAAIAAMAAQAAAAAIPKRPKGRPRKNLSPEKPAPKPKRASASPKKGFLRSDSDSDLSIPEDAPKDTIEAFWDSVEAYCRDITQEDLDRLKKVIIDQETLPEGIFNIPPLGKHFRDDEATQARKMEEARKNKAKDKVGPLTERLVSHLVEERVAMFRQCRDAAQGTSREAGASGSSTSAIPEIFMNRSSLVRALGLDGSSRERDSVPLESRIRECLLDNGLLSPDDPLSEDPDDEIMAEIKRTQRQLRQLHAYNSSTLRDLYAVAERDMRRNLIKRELDQADEELINVYKAMKGPGYKKKTSQSAADIRKMANDVLRKRSDVIKRLNDFDDETRRLRQQRQGAASATVTSETAASEPVPSTSAAARSAAASAAATFRKDDEDGKDNDGEKQEEMEDDDVVLLEDDDVSSPESPAS